jgi:glycosyltransferase involved in cell wall biosynthesis
MKIAIDARWIFREISGIGAYTRELIRHLARLDRDNTYVLLFNDPAIRDRTLAETGLAAAPNFAAARVPYGVFSPLSQLLLPLRLARERVDLYHSPNYLIPLPAFPRRPRRMKCAVTIHDVIPLLFPGHAPRSRKARLFPLYRRLMLEVGARADLIITDSLAARADTIRHLRIPPDREHKVRAVYCGVSERFRPPAARPPKDDRTPRSLLYVGRSDPYKSLPTLIHAVAEAAQACAFPLVLTIAGTPDPRYPEARQAAAQLGIQDAVRWTGYVSDDDLLALYQQADVLVHPSQYEGFGLPVVEAMACGVPVICSSAGALPEVAGDAASLLAPDDVPEFARRIATVLSTPALAAEMSRKGLRQAAQFTWSRTAEETLRLYEGLGR